ncbi:TPM domain-containing protein [Zobellia nedashkovskayae]|uniref:TPM domain-containing protein n=1 Tax=Zobellia nedashkovskayae TaxID=2779510 RepID=UPI00188D2497|nr:TPM domain-containing protein [Zobellia nedashkovskayae]
MKYLKGSLLVILLCCYNLVTAQYQIPDKPKEQTSVYDYINLLSAGQKQTLEQKLIHYSDSTSTQIVVAIISSTEGENINFLGAQWGDKWGIGQADDDNGILILLARDDRRIAINTGYGVESRLTDALSRRIIDQAIVPYFKQNDYYGGLNAGSDAIFQALNGEFKEDRSFDDGGSFPLGKFLPFIIFFVILMILSNRNKRGGGGKNGGKRGNGLDLWDIIILSNMGRSGGSGSFGGGGFGGGSGGGGFGGGFGGGGFGGGGASGGW